MPRPCHGLFITEAKANFNSEFNGQPVRLSGSETDTSFGIKAGLGAAFSIHKNVALFGEYRFTHFSPDVEVSGVKVETNLNTHHLIGGISFRF
jgi:opacity protein-like surface antigen